MTSCQNDETPIRVRPSVRTPMTKAPMIVPHDRAAATGQRGAAEDDRGDRVELEVVARGGVRGDQLRGDDQAHRRGAEAADHVDEHLGAVDAHAGQLRRALVAADRVDARARTASGW